MIHIANRLVKFSSETIWRNLWLSVITVSTITLTLISVSVVVGLQAGIDQIVRATEERVDLSVYFFPAVTDRQVQSVVDGIKTFPGVTTVRTVSKEEALEQYQRAVKDTPELLKPLESLGENPFGPSLVVKAGSPRDYERIIEELAKPQYRDLIEGERKDYEANRAFINNFTSFTERVRLGAVAVSGFFAIVACLLLFNTIRVAIYTHRDEIAVMKLVGATNRFVRTPFLIEAFFYCLVATLLAAGVVAAALHFGQPYLSQYFGADTVNLKEYFARNGIYIFAMEFFFIFILSVVSSWFAVRKYLRV